MGDSTPLEIKIKQKIVAKLEVYNPPFLTGVVKTRFDKAKRDDTNHETECGVSVLNNNLGYCPK
jgi:hypothetical protein